MAEYLSPGVYVEEFDSGSSPMQGVGTSTAGFIGLAEKGAVKGAPALITSQADFNRKFGGYLQENEYGEYRYLAYAVNHFFANGGSRAYIMRVAPSDAKAASAGVPGILEFQAKDPGKWGNSIVVSVEAASKAKTQALEALGKGAYRVKNAAGFEEGDVVVVEGADAPEYNIIASVKDNVITFAADFKKAPVDTNLVPKTVLKTCELNVEVKCDDKVEAYEFISLNASASNFICKKMAKSEIVLVGAKPIDKAISPIDFLKKSFGVEKGELRIALAGGSNGSIKKISAADFIGEDRGPGERTGIQAFLDNSEVSIMAVPGITDPNVQLSLVAHCENLGSRFAVLDMPKDAKSVEDVLAHREIVDSDYCAMYHPWLEVFDPLDKKSTHIPPSGSVVGVYARTDNTRGVHKAPANEPVLNCTGLYCNYNVGEQDTLNPKGVNLIRRFPGSGIRVWGARTASSNALWRYVNVRRLFIYLEESIKANTSWVVFEPNDAVLWTRVRRAVETFLEGIWRSGALAGDSPAQSYYVDIGPNTMTQADIDNGKLICEIGIAPVKPAEFVVFRITQNMNEQ